MGMFGGRKSKEVKQTKSSHLITFGRFVTTSGEQFAFNPDHFDFSGLGALKQLNASLNYRAFIAELARLSAARLNMGARFVLENKTLTLANYQGFHDFETELLWSVNAPAADQPL